MADLREKRKDTGAMPPPYPLLCKQRSWSPDVDREEAWQRRRDLYRSRRRGAAAAAPGARLSRSVTEEDLQELRGCIELGFGFGLGSPTPPASSLSSSTAAASSSPDDADRLSDTLPALDLYYAVHRNRCSSNVSTAARAGAEQSPAGSPLSIYSPGDHPRQVKKRLKQWAQVVACSVRQHVLP